MSRPLRIVRLANFITPVSGGLRTALQHLGEGYLAAGHEPVLVMPGSAAPGRPAIRAESTTQGKVITLPGTPVPGTGGYHVLARRQPVEALLDALAPDRLEVSDRTTLRWTGEWARRNRVPAVMVSHESADAVLRTWGMPPGAARAAADRLNRRTAHAYSRIVCTTAWAAAEFERLGARNVVRAPLGVDLDRFRPALRDGALRARYAGGAAVLLVMCSRLSAEKRPGRALEALAELRRRGVDAALVVAGEGPLRGRLEARARAGGSRSPSSATWPTATGWPPSRPAPTSSSPPAPPRPSDWPRWRHSPAAPPSSPAPCPHSPPSSARPVPEPPTAAASRTSSNACWPGPSPPAAPPPAVRPSGTAGPRPSPRSSPPTKPRP